MTTCHASNAGAGQPTTPDDARVGGAEGLPSAGTGGSTQADNVPQKARQAARYAKDNNEQAQPGYVGDKPFQNDGRGNGEILPKTDANGKPITYKEYDVNPYQPGVNRGPERIVIGNDGSTYYTDDHYKTFKKFE